LTENVTSCDSAELAYLLQASDKCNYVFVFVNRLA
jgi:hypothetical protein